MKMYLVLTCGIGAILWLGFIYTLIKRRFIAGTIMKTLTSVFFMLTLFVATAYNGINLPFTALLGGGLLFGLLGDVALGLKYSAPDQEDLWVKCGFASFEIGHFFYIAATIVAVGFCTQNFISAIAVGFLASLIVIFGEKPMKLNYGPLKALSAEYAAVLFFTTALALFNACTTHNLGLLIMGIGLASFAASDLVLSKMFFGTEGENPRYVITNLFLYYVGQYVIALSPLWIGKLF